MMESILKDTAKQVPSLVVLIILVWSFLKYLVNRDKDTTKYLSDRDHDMETIIREIHEAHLEARLDSRDAIKENTNTTKELTRAITELRVQLKNG